MSIRKTKTHPVICTIKYPDGTLLKVRIPTWKAYSIMALCEHEKSLKDLPL